MRPTRTLCLGWLLVTACGPPPRENLCSVENLTRRWTLAKDAPAEVEVGFQIGCAESKRVTADRVQVTVDDPDNLPVAHTETPPLCTPYVLEGGLSRLGFVVTRVRFAPPKSGTYHLTAVFDGLGTATTDVTVAP